MDWSSTLEEDSAGVGSRLHPESGEWGEVRGKDQDEPQVISLLHLFSFALPFSSVTIAGKMRVGL